MINYKLMVPKNDNLLPVIRGIFGETLFREITALTKSKALRKIIPIQDGNLEMQIARGEDVACNVLSFPDVNRVGVTGSDFVLAEIVSGRHGHFHHAIIDEKEVPLWKYSTLKGRNYVDLQEIGRRLKNMKGSDVWFMSEPSHVRMRVVDDYGGQPPYLCVLGTSETDYDSLVKERVERGTPLTVACEGRFRDLAQSFLDAQQIQLGVDYDLRTVTGSTEGFIAAAKRDRGRKDLYDLGFEIGRTFETAKANGLVPYVRIMPTSVVTVSCCESGDEDKIINFADLKARAESSNYAAAIPAAVPA